MLGWELPPHNSGGLGVACYHLAKALAAKGTTIDFVLPYTAAHADVEFMTIHHASTQRPIPYSATGVYDSSIMTEGSSLRELQRQYTTFVERHITNTPQTYDAIHAHDWLTIEAGIRAKELTNLPLIVHVHSTEYDRSGGSTGNPLARAIEYQGLIMADRIVAVSAVTKSIIIAQYGIPADKIEVLHNAIDVASFDNGYLYDQRTYSYLEGLKSEGYTVISAVTRFTVQKGLTQLLQAVAKAVDRYDRLVLLLAGDGEQRDELIALAARLGIADRVFFTGFVRGKQWRDAYSVSDIFVLSSISEPFGLTALEAAHHDTALVITKQSGVSEVLHSMFTYDFWDTDKLADQLVGIATSPALQSSLKKNVLHEYARLSWDDVAETLLTTYQQTRHGALV